MTRFYFDTTGSFGRVDDYGELHPHLASAKAAAIRLLGELVPLNAGLLSAGDEMAVRLRGEDGSALFDIRVTSVQIIQISTG